NSTASRRKNNCSNATSMAPSSPRSAATCESGAGVICSFGISCGTGAFTGPPISTNDQRRTTNDECEVSEVVGRSSLVVRRFLLVHSREENDGHRVPFTDGAVVDPGHERDQIVVGAHLGVLALDLARRDFLERLDRDRIDDRGEELAA